MKPEVAFGIVLRKIRRELDLSQETLALEAGLQRNYISLLERGLNSASIKTLFKVAPVLRTTVASMMEETESLLKTSSKVRMKKPR